MKHLAVITARSGSKGLKDKNIKLLEGKPLLVYSIEAARQSGKFDCIHVSTDSEKYAQIAREHGADVPFLRDAALATDTAGTWDVLRAVVQQYAAIGQQFDTITLLQPTSPLRDAADIKMAFEIFEEKNAQSVVSVCEAEHSPLLCNTLKEDQSMCGFVDLQKVERCHLSADHGTSDESGRSVRRTFLCLRDESGTFHRHRHCTGFPDRGDNYEGILLTFFHTGRYI